MTITWPEVAVLGFFFLFAGWALWLLTRPRKYEPLNLPPYPEYKWTEKETCWHEKPKEETAAQPKSTKSR